MNKLKEVTSNLIIINESDSFITVKSKTGPSPIVTLPKNTSFKLLVLLGLILGDGHLKKAKPKIFYESINYNIVAYVKELLKEVFQLNCKLRTRYRRNQTFYYIDPNNRAVQTYINKVFDVPIGKKSSIIKMPRNLDTVKRAQLFIGYFIADGGIKMKGLSITSKSSQIINDCETLFNELKIKSYKGKWYNKKYKDWYYSIKFKTLDLIKLLNYAGVSERSNEPGLGMILNEKLEH